MATQHTIDVQLRLLGAAVSSGFGQMSGQLSKLQGQADSFSRTMKAAFGFHELERFGKAGMNAFGGMISQAAQLQESMTKVQVATGASATQMGALGKLITDTSSKHAMGVKQAADMIAVAARTGMTTDTISKTFGNVSMFADVEHFERGMGFEESSKLAASVARFFGARNATDSDKVLNNLYRAMNATPIAPGELFKSIQNFEPIGARLGMSQESVFQMASLMGTMGLGTKGGTGLFNVLLRSIGKTPSLTGHRETAQLRAFKDLGLFDAKGNNLAFTDGKVDVAKLFAQLTKVSEKLAPAQFVKDLIGAFNDRGGRVAAALSTPEAQENLAEMMKGWAKITSLQEAYALEQKNLTFQTSVLSSNFNNLQATMGDFSAKAMTPLTEKLADWTSSFDKWLKAHPDAATRVGGIVAEGTAISAMMELAGKVGSAGVGIIALKSLFTGAKGLPVYVTNIPGGGGFPGGPGIPGGKPGGGAFPTFSKIAGGVGGALGATGKLIARGATALTSDVGAAAGAAGLSLYAIGEGLYALSESGRTSEARTRSIYDAVSNSPVPKEELQRRLDAARNVLHPGGAGDGGSIHIHGPLTINSSADNLDKLATDLRLAANRSSGSSSTGPVHSTSSGFGNPGGP